MPKVKTKSTKLLGGQRPTMAAGLDAGGLSLSSMVPARAGRMRNLLDLVRQIRDYNADASKAVSNILRLANSGWTITAYKPDGTTTDEESQELVDALVKAEEPRIGLEYGGGLDVLIDMIHLTAATQGAVAGEVELTAGLDDVADILVVNPWLVDFERDPETRRFVPGIRKLGSFTPLHPLQFKYIPLDPEPGDPRGRSPFWAALDIIFFQMEVLRDLKAAAHFAGYPRVDISVAWESVYKTVESMRPDLLEPGKEDSLRAWLDGYLGDIEDMIESLNPDDAFVHYDAVSSTYITPTGRSIDLQQLIATIDTQIVSGLKQLPVLLGRNEGTTTTHATVQWQVFVRELESYQRVSAHLLSWALSLALRVWGRQGIVKVQYKPIRSSERLQDAQAEQIETLTKAEQVRLGWITNDDAALAIVGHEAEGEPQPAPEPGGVPEGGADDEERALRALTRAAGLEDISPLPYWQQERYRTTERSTWEAYRAQVRRAWGRLEEEIRDEEGWRGLPARPSVNGKNGHKTCKAC